MNLIWLTSITVLGSLLTVRAHYVLITYTDPKSNENTTMTARAVFGRTSEKKEEYGRAVHVLTEAGKNDGCGPHANAPTEYRWIAVIERGGCNFQHKIGNATIIHNASAVVVYQNVKGESPFRMADTVHTSVAVMVPKYFGNRLAALLDSNVTVYLEIKKGPKPTTQSPATTTMFPATGTTRTSRQNTRVTESNITAVTPTSHSTAGQAASTQIVTSTPKGYPCMGSYIGENRRDIVAAVVAPSVGILLALVFIGILVFVACKVPTKKLSLQTAFGFKNLQEDEINFPGMDSISSIA